ncbi:MAG: AarF/ABC1/UbiB kinase family protein [Deltaproteobacteria bacterium]|nr:AarF/ABC1/UbiB kinase family protein [Deltaproteobacteria bacterium]
MPTPRFLRAYWLFLVVLTSYLLVWVKKRILGEGWMKPRISEIHRRNARRIERTILDLKGLFIKVGQMLSIMSNFLPDELRSGLEGLQDAVPPHPYPAIEKRFLQEFSKRPLDLFRSFEEKPIASASLGQVHVAYLADGTKVAVKVQYPEIEKIVRSDLKTLKRIFGLLHLFFPAYGLRQVYAEIAQVIQQELDYQYEAKNLEAIRKNFEKEEDFLFPDIFWDLSTKRILTLRFMEGIKVSAVDELKAQKIDPTTIATKIIHAYCKQIFLDGVYHADPHPGNLLVQDNGKIILVDFGAIATVSEPMRKGMARFAEGLIKRDTRILADAMRQMGFVAREEGMEPFEGLIDYFYGKLSNLKIESFKDLNVSGIQSLEEILELKKLKINFKDLMGSFHVPKDWVLLERTMLLVFGLSSHLDPKLNPMEIVLPYVERFVLQDKPISEVVVSLTKEVALSYLQLPREIHRSLQRLHAGELSFKSPELKAQTQKIYLLGHQILYGLLFLGGLFLGLRFEEVGFVAESRYAYGGGGLFGFVLLLSLIKNRRG